MIQVARLSDLNLIEWRWPHFRPAELVCECSHSKTCDGAGSLLFHEETLDRLEKLRLKYAAPMVITSGYRSPEHNDRVSNTGRTGPHTTGRAVDVKVVGGAARFRLIELAIEFGFTGIGVAKSFVHLDDVPVGEKAIPRPAIWTY